MGLLENSKEKQNNNVTTDNDGYVSMEITNLKLLDLGRILGERRSAAGVPALSVSSTTGLLSLDEKWRERMRISSAVGTVGK